MIAWKKQSPREMAGLLLKLAKSDRPVCLEGLHAIFINLKKWQIREISTISWALAEMRQPFPLSKIAERFLRLATKTGNTKGVDWAQMTVAVATIGDAALVLRFLACLTEWVDSHLNSLTPVDMLVIVSSLCNFISRL